MRQSLRNRDFRLGLGSDLGISRDDLIRVWQVACAGRNGPLARRSSAVSEGLVAEGFEAGFFEGVAVEHVVGVEGDETLAVGVGDVDAGFFDAAEIEGLGVDELDDEDAEEIVVAEIFGGEDLREAAEEFAECVGLRLRGVVGGEEFEDLIAEIWVLLDGGADCWVLFVDDGVAAAVDEDVGGDEAGEGDDFSG